MPLYSLERAAGRTLNLIGYIKIIFLSQHDRILHGRCLLFPLKFITCIYPAILYFTAQATFNICRAQLVNRRFETNILVFPELRLQHGTSCTISINFIGYLVHFQ